MQKKILLVCLQWLLVIAPTASTTAEINFKKLDNPLSVAEFNLQDQFGNEFNREKLNGVWTLMFTGFTSCPDVCPFTLGNLEAVRAQLSMQMMPEKLPQVVFLAVDPARDKIHLQQYMAHFHKEFFGITGQKSEIDRLAKSIDSFYRLDKPKAPGAYYNVVHSSSIAVISPDVRVVATLSPPFAANETAGLLLRLFRNQENSEKAELVKVDNAWTPTAPTGIGAHAGYLTINNLSHNKLTIIGFESTAYASISLHASEMQDGVMSMHELEQLVVPANSSVTLQPMARHLMMVGPKFSASNEEFVVTMKTQEYGSIQFKMEIKNLLANG